MSEPPRPLRRFTDKVALVTGAASGIGRATAARLAQEGARVAAVDIQADRLHTKTEALLSATGADFLLSACDVSDEAQVKATVAATVEHFGRLDVLCNIAGILRADHTHELALTDWQRIIDVNLTGCFLMCREALPHLLETKGNIVNMSSNSAQGSHPWMAAYAASKGGILSLTKAIAAEYPKQGIRANAVCPGGIATPLHGQFSVPDGADLDLIKKAVPFVPYVGPEWAASVVAFLASEDACYMNGTALRVDGGALP